MGKIAQKLSSREQQCVCGSRKAELSELSVGISIPELAVYSHLLNCPGTVGEAGFSCGSRTRSLKWHREFNAVVDWKDSEKQTQAGSRPKTRYGG